VRERSIRFRSRTSFAPEFQLRPDTSRTFQDARQSPVFLARTFFQDITVDALPVVANPQSKELAVVGDFGLDLAGARVLKSISQDLPRNRR
jgi:hypothetical protein